MLTLHLDTCALRVAQVRSEKDHHPSVAMSVEQAHQRLGIAGRVTHEQQEQLQRVSAGHQATHQELGALRSQADTRSRVRLVEPKTVMPDRFGRKEERPGELGHIWQGTSSAQCMQR